jgi:hypothetical protein
MKRQLLRLFAAVANVTVVLVILGALCVSSAAWGTRSESYGVKPHPLPVPPVTGVALIPGPPSSDQPANNMTPNGKPTTQQVACFSVPYLNNHSQNDRKQVLFSEPSALQSTADCLAQVVIAEPKSSVCLISSSVGRQFTLVGAKPSGTS